MSAGLEGFRLSPQQKRLWLSQQRDGFPFLCEASIRIDGRLDRTILTRALPRVVAAHEILRTRYRSVPGLQVPLQVIVEDDGVELTDDISASDLSFEDGPLVRFALSQEDRAGDVLRISASVLCVDDRSMRTLAAEVFRAYEAVRTGSDFESDPIQYVQFAEWQHEMLADSHGAGNRFWAQQHSEPSTDLCLPCESPGGACRPPKFVSASFAFPETGSALRSVLLTCWKAQLFRLTMAPVIGVRVCFEGRPYDEMREGLGLYERWPLLRTKIGAEMAFEELLETVDFGLREAESWQEYYADERCEGGIGFEYREEEELAGAWVVEELSTWSEGLKLKVVCVRSGPRVRVQFWYDEGRYERGRIEWLSEGFGALLGSVSGPRRVQELAVLGPSERRSLERWSWGGPAVQQDGAQTLVEQFAAVVAAQPDCIALVGGEEHYSYGALQRHSVRLGRRLQEAGVQVEEAVGLSLERSATQLLAMLGIVHAGAAYAPLEVDWPWLRKRQVAQELGLRVVVGSARGRGEWQELGVSVVDPEELPRHGAGDEPWAQALRGPTAEHLAYVLYTSGSTGRAKGVMVRQGSVVQLWRALRERVYEGAPGGQRVALNAGLSFDASVKQWVQWLSGDVIEVVPEEVRGDGARLGAWLQERGVEWVDATPTQWQWVVAQAARGTPPPRVLLGGEAVGAQLWRQVGEHGRGWNLYGPTECTVDASTTRIEGSRALIGTPLPGVRIYVLDEQGHLAPAGVEGAIWIGGAGLGRGYVGQADATAERWRPDALSGERGARLYGSGDRGRYTAGGQLEYLGREDGQVKLRGYRVELGEVEALLREHAWVREAAVAVRADRLVGYVALEGGGAQGRVRHRLPNGMEIVAHSRAEADALYEEIFVEQVYARHGITLPAEAVVIDAGANIGLFTLWVCQHYRSRVRVWALEPIAAVAGTLRRNVARYAEQVRVRQEGVGGSDRWERFTYYRGAPALSGMSRYADEVADRAVVQRVAAPASVLEALDSEEQLGYVRTLASLLREEGIERVDLLKVDVQRAEREVLAGIGEEDWKKIQQIVIEVHEDVEPMGRLLESKGYVVCWEQGVQLAGSDRYNLYARRAPSDACGSEARAAAEVAVPSGGGAESNVEEALRRHLRERVPEYMVPGVIVVLERLPLTRSGKVDRQGLPEPVAVAAGGAGQGGEGYSDQTEEIVAGIWGQVLGRAVVGRKENFFELGGHSLLATQVMARLRKALGVELALRALFEAPTVAGLSRRVRAAGAAAPEARALEPVRREGPLPASSGQQRLWFLQQLEPASAYYNCPGAVRLRGALDADALEGSLRALLERHQVLRTRYRMQEGELVQVVGASAELQLRREACAPEALGLRVAAEARQRFDLARELPLRALLLGSGAQEWVLVLTLHHIAADGWSMRVLVRELSALYGGQRLAPLPLQYGDYAVWERARAWEGALAYWKQRLAGMAPALELATDHARPAVRSHAGAQERLELSAPLSERIGQFSRQQGVSEYMTLLAGLAVVLWRYSGQGDIAVGTALGGREREELEELIGLFINTVVVRLAVAPEARFSQLLAQVREEVLSGQQHGGVPFERVVEAVQPQRSLRQGPLAQVMFLYEGQVAGGGPLQLAGVECEEWAVDTGTAKFDVTLGVSRQGGRLTAHWEYSRELWEPASARRMLESWVCVLESALAEPQRPLWELAWVSAREREQVIAEWNHTERTWEGESNLVWWVNRQGQERPDAIAVEVDAEGEQLSYAELWRRAANLAGALRERGLRPEERVGVCTERGSAMVVAVLGVLQAGGAYVPLEPVLPGARLHWMLEDTGARIALTDAHGARALAHWPGVRLDIHEHSRVQPLPGAPSPPIHPQQLAYVIYTSGSTGQPKGVAVPHIGVVRLVCETNYIRFSPADTVAQMASFGFDILAFEVWGPLLHGGRIAILSRDTVLAPARLADAFRRFHIDVAILAATLFNQVAREEPFAFQTLTSVIVGGEALDPHWIGFILRTAPPTRLLNGYGPTENSVLTTCERIESVESGDRSIPIGRPISNTETYILDDNLQPLPAGVEGWLCTAGAGLARGYVGSPSLTAASFLPNPFGRTPGSRMYLTGDRARYLPDGRIDYVGRRDDQAKIRGHRIELGEVQAAVQKCPGVLASAVIVREDLPGERYLAAYVSGSASTEAMRAHLRMHLPDYMVPAAFVVVDALPLTEHGKLDRSALPRPGGGATQTEGYVAPAAGVEEGLVALWLQLLPVDRVGIHDNFFEIGGHSLLATRLISRIRDNFRCDLQLRSIWEHPTIAGLAPLIRTTDHPLPRIVALAPEERRQVPLSFAQQRLWFLSRLEPDNPAYTCIIALRLFGSLNESALGTSLQQLIERHETLRTRFVQEETGPWQIVESSVTLQIQREVLSDREDLPRRLAQEIALPFDLENGTPLRVRLLREAAQEHVLLISLHHIVWDGWSLGVLMREWGALYGAACQGRVAQLPPLPVQYADFAVWQRRCFQGIELERQVSYWRERLQGIEHLEIPGDRPRPLQPSYGGGRVRVQVAPQLRTQLEQLSRSRGVTLFTTLLAVLKLLLYRYTGQLDIAVGSPVAGRNEIELEGLIGFFVNTLVLRTDLSGNPRFVDLLDRVNETALAAYSHQDIPFERLVAELDPERSLSHNPLFQIMFVYQNMPEEALDLAGLRYEWVDCENNTAKFDLLLGLGPRPDGTLEGSIEFSRDLYEAETIHRMTRHWIGLLEAAVATPEAPIGSLEMLSAAERSRVLDEWNRTERESHQPSSVVELWERQVELTPDRIALETNEGAISYRALDRLANGIAGRLCAEGAGPEVCVGLCVDRSECIPAGILAAWKAGAAWVPMDPAYPAQRLEWIADDARLGIVVSKRSTANKLPAIAAKLVLLENIEPADLRPPRQTHSGNLAYVIYTSGSTGRPKGVAISHANLAALLAWAGTVFSDDDIAAVVAGTSICFDLSLFELFVPLTRGGTVLLVDHILELPHFPARGRATLINTVPSAIAELLRESAISPSVRVVNLAGEPLKADVVDRIYAVPSVQKVYDLYGPSEDTTYSTYALRRPGGPAVIGVPIDNTRVYLLDGRYEPVPVGVGGEIYLGGAGLARGYLGRPELTAERWLPDPFSGRLGARLYRTGDRGRWNAHGQIEYLGRVDQQVKIRGFRIEPGEIEAVLCTHPAIKEAAVVARQGRLVAYVSGGEAHTEALRRYLSERLPDYMLPGIIVPLAQLPRTPNGKLDRRALPEPEHRPSAARAPRTAVEAELVRIWSRTLGREHVGVDENFFQLGGDSILSIQIVARARQAGLRVTVRQMFQHQSIAELAGVVEPAAASAAEQGEVSGSVALTPIQRWFFAQEFAEPHHWNQAVMLRLAESWDRAGLDQAWQAVVRHHDGLRQRFRRTTEGWQGWQEAAGGEAPLEWVTVSDRCELEAIAAQRQTSLDLSSGPLVRAVVFDLGAQGKRLLIVAHHLVVDGVSWRILLEDLERASRREALPPKTSSWRSWSLRAAELERQASAMAPAVAAEPWPVAHEQGANLESLADTVRVSLSEAATRALLERGAIQGSLLAALAGALTRHSGARRVTVDVEGHGREEVFADLDLTRTVGWFTRVRALTLEVKAGETLVERAQRLEAQVRESQGPPVQAGAVSFNYLGQFDREPGAQRSLDWAEESTGAVHSARAARSYEWEINAAVRGGRLGMEWIYARQRHPRRQVEEAAGEFLKQLEELGADPVEARYALTPMQQGMLFHMLWEPEGGMYYEQLRLELEGEVNPGMWRQAWQQVVDRHEALRTEVHWQGQERPMQVVKRQVAVELEAEDWSALSESASRQQLEGQLQQERRAGFVLERAPLLRLRLIWRGGQRWECLWSHPHLLLDGWAVPIILAELLEIYGALRQGRVAVLPAPGRYRDYVAWLERQDVARAEVYWRTRLRGVEAPAALPAERARREKALAGSYGEQVRELSAALTAGLEQAARQEQLTLNTLVQGAWGIVMARHSGRSEVMFGATVSGRPAELPAVERTVGLFLNTLPVRVVLKPEPRWAGEWLRELQQQEVQARQYEYTSLAQIQGWSGITPLFESLLVFENYPVDGGGSGELERAAGIRLTRVQSWEQTNYPLTLVVVPGRCLRLRMSYQQERFAEEAIQGLLEQLERALLGLAQPRQRLAAIDILGHPERERLLALGRGGCRQAPQHTVVTRFEAQAAARPDAIALVSEEHAWSYRALNEWANRIAWWLIGQGAGPETRVGLQLERGAGTVAAVLGVLKAGAAYVPLEPGLPAARLHYLRQDADAPLVLTDADLHPRAPHAPNPPHRAALDNLAYLIYTSGSSGLPKAVLITHANLAARTEDMIGRYGIDANHRLPVFISLSFDACAEELFPALASGGVLLIPPDPSGSSSFSFLASCEMFAATALHLPAAYWERMVRELDTAERTIPPSIRLCIIGGEAVEPDALSRWQRVSQGARLWNAYGPTEATITASTGDLSATHAHPLCIGRPLPGTEFYLLDRDLELVPAGASGEIFIGGNGIARGYAGRPELTAQLFVPDPYSTSPGSRLYRTGDRGRLNHFGEFEFLGRSDRQVKIRGFRVELDEIERTIETHPGIAEAFVALSNQMLVAWVSPAAAAEPVDLRDFLEQRLPAHMLPTRIETIAALPRTPVGKVDYRALPEPAAQPVAGTPHSDEPYAFILIGLCQDLMRNPLVNTSDSFFSMGGDSLLAIQLASRIRTAFDVDISVQAIFEAISLGDLARTIARIKAAEHEAPPLIQPVPRREPLPLSFAQQNLWRVNAALPDTFTAPVVQALHFQGPLNSEALERALLETVRRHEALRTTFVEENGRPWQRIAVQAEVELGTWDLTRVAPQQRPEQVSLVARREIAQPFDLLHGPLFRAALLCLDTHEHVLILSMHHIISDGWSVRNLTSDLIASYDAYSAGNSPQLPPLRIQFADYATWEQDCAASGLFRADLQYWKLQLAGVHDDLRFAPDPLVSQPLATMGQEGTRIGLELSQRLLEWARRERSTPFIMLCTAWMMVLRQYSATGTVSLCTLVANRTRADTEDVVGLFLNTVILRTNLSAEMSFRDAAGRVRSAALGAYAHQGLPFELLVREIGTDVDHTRASLSRVMFVFENTDRGGRQTNGTRITPTGLGSPDAVEASAPTTFDLVLVADHGAEGIQCMLRYRQEIFARETIQRHLADLVALVESSVSSSHHTLVDHAQKHFV